MIPEKNIIQRMSVQLDVHPDLDMINIRQKVMEVLNTKLENKLNEIIETGPEVIRIESLKIDLGNLQSNDLEDRMVEELANQIKKIEHEISAKQVKSLSEEVNQWSQLLRRTFSHAITEINTETEDFLFYLSYGVRTWWSQLNTVDEKLNFFNNSLKNIEKIKHKNALKQIVQFVQKNQRAKERFLQFLSLPKVKEAVCVQLFGNHYAEWDVLITYFKSETPNFAFFESEALLKVIESATQQNVNSTKWLRSNVPFIGFELIQENSQIEAKKLFKSLHRLKVKVEQKQKAHKIHEQKLTANKEQFLALLAAAEKYEQKIIPEQKQSVRKAQKQNIENTTEAEKLSETVIVEYAGAVLLWPLVSTLFTNRKLMVNNQFIDEESQQKALQLLHYVVSGKEVVDETELPLIKLLCGYEITAVIPFKSCLSIEDKAEADIVLNHLIENWSALKNTSIGGLRQAFLNREGELVPENESWLLKVVPQGIDILMKKIPWGISMVKLPWMNKILQVEW